MTTKEQIIRTAIETNGSVYVSITGLLCHSIFTVPSFYYHAIPSKIQADSAAGNLFSDVKDLNSYHHTLTVWENKKAMIAYLTTGAHKEAMKQFKNIGTGITTGYETASLEDTKWEGALQHWKVKYESSIAEQAAVQEDSSTEKAAAGGGDSSTTK